MDFQFIEPLLELPEFRVIGQVMRPCELQLPLVRRDSYLVCPDCQGCSSWIKEGRDRCRRALPIFELSCTLWLHIRSFKCSDCHRVEACVLDMSKSFDSAIKEVFGDSTPRLWAAK